MAELKTLSHEPATEAVRLDDKLDIELSAFERMRPELLKTHRGLFVAIHHGAVLAADADDFRLAAQVEDLACREGAIAICRVCEEDETEAEDLYADFESPSIEEGDA